MTYQRYIDVHVLQSVPPSNLNRDDAGSPKQAMFGGVRRSRVSSQAWKRATRKMFAEAESVPAGGQATRTRLVSKMLTEPLVERGVEPDMASRLASTAFGSLDIKVTDGNKEDGNKRGAETPYLLFLGRQQLDRITDVLAGKATELAALDDTALKKELKGLRLQDELLKGHPIDVALFGRMVADQATLNVDAAVQVAHAISTHPVEIEFDYFTAVDDEKERDEEAADVGAAMIGTVEFNSATLYRYATVGFDQLVENLGGSVEHAADAVERFIDGFVRSIPTGHQNSFAHRTLPSTVVVALRDDQPVNLVSAFEKPIRSADGLAEKSAQALARELVRVQANWVGDAALVLGCYDARSDEIATTLHEAFGPSRPFTEVLTEVRHAITEHHPASVGVA